MTVIPGTPHSSPSSATRRFGVPGVCALALLIAAACGPARAGEAPRPPQRHVSICGQGDQLLLQLVDRSRNVALSDLANDPDISPHWREARGIPVIAGNAEDLLKLQPDLVIAGRATTRSAVTMLKQLGVPVLEISVPDDFNELHTQILTMSARLGVESRGREIVAAMDARLARLKAAMPAEAERPTAMLYFQDRFTPGGHTFANAILEAAGFRNLGARFNAGVGASAPLEAVLLARPRFLILSRYRENHPTATQVSDAQPVFQKLAPGTAVFSISFRHLACPDPANLDLVEMLHERVLAARGKNGSHGAYGSYELSHKTHTPHLAEQPPPSL